MTDNGDRNFGILTAFLVFFLGVYILAAEFISTGRSKGEVLVFQRGYRSPSASKSIVTDEETGSVTCRAERSPPEWARQQQEKITPPHGSNIFHWRDICYDITIKGEPRRILNEVNGWVKPGTLTALMVSCYHSRVLIIAEFVIF